MIDVEKLDSLRTSLLKVMEDNLKHTIPPHELSKMSSELATAKLNLGTFKDKFERAEYAREVAERELVAAKKISADLKQEVTDSSGNFKAQLTKLQSELDKAKTASREANDAVKGARKEDPKTVDVSKLEVQVNSARAEVTRLNNAIQSLRAEHGNVKRKSDNFEQQVLSLSNELNIARAQVDTKSGSTFARVAQAAGTAPVQLYNTISSHLSKRSKAFIEKAKESAPEDLKNKTYWLKNALQSSKFEPLKAYYVIVDQLYQDMLVLSWEGRKYFSPIIDNLVSTLDGSGEPISPEEIDSMLNSVDLSKLKLSKRFRDRGIHTLQDYDRAGLKPHELGIEDFDETESLGTLDPEVRRVLAGKKKPKPFNEPRPKGGFFFSTFDKVWDKVKTKTKSTFSRTKDRATRCFKAIRNIGQEFGFWGQVAAVPLVLIQFLKFW
jgi:predicted  nucleic acid-binding Zn-ribbon protein